MKDLEFTFKALADSLRLRVLRVLAISELSVAELVQVLGVPQSTVSRHLKPLRDAQLVETRRDGTHVFYRLGSKMLSPVWESFMDQQFEDVVMLQEDRASVRRVLDERARQSIDFFNRMAGSYETLTEPGGGWNVLAATLASCFTGKDVVDLGAGEGKLSLILARYAASVTSVDISPRMLELIRMKAAEASCQKVLKTVEADIENVPLPDGASDVVFLSQTLHHAGSPKSAILEAARLLRPGGKFILLELDRHDQEWLREEWADQWLGFEMSDLESWVGQAGLCVVHAERQSGATPGIAVISLIAEKKK